jgi:hypothetical protein
VTVGCQAASDIATHPAQADDPKLHHPPPALLLFGMILHPTDEDITGFGIVGILDT